MVNVRFFFLTLFLSIGYGILCGVDTQLPLPNSGFETLAADGFPAHWRIEGKETIPGIRVKIDNQHAHSGEKSLQMSHDQWGKSMLVSDLLAFKVGELYRLSGWIKTDSAVTWPKDRYPTSVAACLTMESLPFTNHSPSVGATTNWKKIETLFIASRSQDRVHLHLGYNGNAKGDVWFDDVQVQKVENISGYIPMETVKWFGPAFRYDDKGWIFIHIEGKPYQRGYQYGYLLADEIAAYMNKLANDDYEDNPEAGWQQMSQITHAFMVGKYDEEYLVEMKGIADGAAKAGAAFAVKPVDFLNIVTVNSFIDIDSAWRALRFTPHPLSGRNFLDAEDELSIPLKEHKCSGFLANGPATTDGGFVFGQIFMCFKEKPLSVKFNAGNDIPVPQENFYTFSNYFDDFHHAIFVYGTSRQIEADHTLTLRYRDTLADRYTEILPPVKKDSEVSEEELASHDLFVLGGTADNGLMERMVKKLGLSVGKNFFQWQRKTYGAVDDGLFAAFPNPFNPQKTVYLVIANSALQLYQMTKRYEKLPSWALFKKDEIVKQGYHPVKNFNLTIDN